MTWRSVLVYWLLAAGAAANLHSVWRDRGPMAEVQSRPVVPIIATAAASIDAVRARRGEVSVELERRGEQWVVTRPAGLSVSNDLVDALLDTLTTIPPVEMLDGAGEERAGDPQTEQFGLDPPGIVLELASAGALVATVELGQRNPTRTAVYARLPEEDRLYLLGLNAQYYVELIYEQIGKQGLGAAAP